MVKIRRANTDDALSVAVVQVNSWKTTYKNIIPDSYLKQMTYKNREKKWKQIISSQTVFVAENNNGQIIGFSNVGGERTGKYPGYDGELYAIYILREYQGKGIGKLLLKYVMKHLEENGIISMTVCVLEENKSRLFYERFGAKKMDCVRIEIMGKELNELVYGWRDITK